METQIAIKCKVDYEYHEGHLLEVGKFLDQVVFIRKGSEMVYQNENVINDLNG